MIKAWEVALSWVLLIVLYVWISYYNPDPERARGYIWVAEMATCVSLITFSFKCPADRQMLTPATLRLLAVAVPGAGVLALLGIKWVVLEITVCLVISMLILVVRTVLASRVTQAKLISTKDVGNRHDLP